MVSLPGQHHQDQRCPHSHPVCILGTWHPVSARQNFPGASNYRLSSSQSSRAGFSGTKGSPVKLRGFLRKPQEVRPSPAAVPEAFPAHPSAHSYILPCSGHEVPKLLLSAQPRTRSSLFWVGKMAHVFFFSSHFQNKGNRFLNKTTLVPDRQLTTQSLALAVPLKHSK